MTDLTKARAMFEANLSVDKDWSPYRCMVRNVFTHYSERAFTREQVELIARGAEGLPADASLADALLFFTRRKVLRTRREQGKKFYEVNY